jgi:hypothetical protein
MIKWNESRKLSRSRLLPQMPIDPVAPQPPQRKLACAAQVASELRQEDNVAVAQRMRQCSRCGQIVRVRVGWPHGCCCKIKGMRLRLRRQRQRQCKDDVELSGKILEPPSCFEIAGNHVHRPSLPLKVKLKEK